MVHASVDWPSVIWNCKEWVRKGQGIGKDRLVLGSAFFKAIATKGSQCSPSEMKRRRGASQDRGLVESVTLKVYRDQESSLVHVTSFFASI